LVGPLKVDSIPDEGLSAELFSVLEHEPKVAVQQVDAPAGRQDEIRNDVARDTECGKIPTVPGARVAVAPVVPLLQFLRRRDYPIGREERQIARRVAGPVVTYTPDDPGNLRHQVIQ
jgi:hypothetical protein